MQPIDRKSKQPGWRPWTCTPEGEVLAALCIVVLMRPMLPCGLLCPRTAGERWCRRHQRGGRHRRLIIVMLLKKYECRRLNVEHTLPSRENKNVWKKYRHMFPVPFRRHPLWWLVPPPFPLTGALWVLGIPDNLCLWKLRRENRTTGLRPVEMHPFCRLWRRLPRRGRF